MKMRAIFYALSYIFLRFWLFFCATLCYRCMCAVFACPSVCKQCKIKLISAKGRWRPAAGTAPYSLGLATLASHTYLLVHPRLKNQERGVSIHSSVIFIDESCFIELPKSTSEVEFREGRVISLPLQHTESAVTAPCSRVTGRVPVENKSSVLCPQY